MRASHGGIGSRLRDAVELAVNRDALRDGARAARDHEVRIADGARELARAPGGTLEQRQPDRRCDRRERLLGHDRREARVDAGDDPNVARELRGARNVATKYARDPPTRILVGDRRSARRWRRRRRSRSRPVAGTAVVAANVDVGPVVDDDLDHVDARATASRPRGSCTNPRRRAFGRRRVRRHQREAAAGICLSTETTGCGVGREAFAAGTAIASSKRVAFFIGAAVSAWDPTRRRSGTLSCSVKPTYGANDRVRLLLGERAVAPLEERTAERQRRVRQHVERAAPTKIGGNAPGPP